MTPEQLFSDHIGRVKALVNSYCGKRFGFLKEDIESEAMTGLWQACLRHQETTNNTFWTFAYTRVWGAVIDFLRRERLLVRMDGHRYGVMVHFVPLPDQDIAYGKDDRLSGGHANSTYGSVSSGDAVRLGRLSADKSKEALKQIEDKIYVDTIVELSGIDEKQKKAISGVFYEDKTIKQVAASIGMREWSTASLIKNTTEQLRAEPTRG